VVVEDVPVTHQIAAEEIRAHLVQLRGGAPFLSSADARLLVEWLDGGVSVSDVLLALERAAASLRKQRSRVPLSLVRARPHLGKSTAPARPRVPSARHPFDGVLVEVPHELLAGLVEVPLGAPHDMVRAALALVRRFLDEQWLALADEARESAISAAKTDLLAIDPYADPAEIEALAESWAREDLRARYPQLSAASLLARVPA
jgi:hypothetical protein